MTYEDDIEQPRGEIGDLPKDAQEIYMAAYNSAWEKNNHNDELAQRAAWAAVEKAGYEQDEESGEWRKTA